MLVVNNGYAEQLTSSQMEYVGDLYRDPFFISLQTATEEVAFDAVAVVSRDMTEDEVREKFKLQGVVWNTSRMQAIINNRIIQSGDTLDNAVIEDISNLGVRLNYLGKSYLLKREKK